MMSNNTSLTTDDPDWIATAVQVTGVVTFLIGFPTNIAIMLLVATRRSLRKPTNYFVCSLAVADVMVLLCMTVWIIGIHAFPLTKTLHKYIYPSLDIFLGITSMINVACVSIDRAFAVAYPLKYQNMITRKRTWSAIASCWIFSFIILALALLRAAIEIDIYNKAILYLAFACYFIPVLVVISCYSIILLVVIRQLKGILELEKVLSNSSHIFDGLSHTNIRIKRSRQLLRELKITGNILLLVLPFTVGWTFFIGTHIYEEVEQKMFANVGWNFAIIIIPWILSGLNPILYLTLNRQLRRAFIDFLHSRLKSKSLVSDDSKSSLLASFSRRASNIFRRTSGSDGLNLFRRISTETAHFNRRISTGDAINSFRRPSGLEDEESNEPRRNSQVRLLNVRGAVTAVNIIVDKNMAEEATMQYLSVV